MDIINASIEIKLTASQRFCLRNIGINTVQDLTKINKYDLLRYRGFGEKTVNKIGDYLKQHGYDTTEYERIPKRYQDKIKLKYPRTKTKPEYELTTREENEYIIPSIKFEGIPITLEQFELLKKRLEKTTGKTAFIDVITKMMLTQPYHKPKD